MNVDGMDTNLLNLIVTNLNDVIATHGLNGECLYVSPSVQKVLGYTPEELVGTVSFDYHHPEDGPRIKERLAGATAGESAGDTRYEYRIRRKDGCYCWLESEASRIFDASGHLAKLLVISRDITARKQAEESQRESERRLRDFVRAVPDVSMILDEDGRHVEVFGEHAMLPRPAKELKGLTLHQVLREADAEHYLRAIRRTLRNRRPETIINEITIDGRRRVVEGRMVPMQYRAASKKTVAFVIADITEKQRAASVAAFAFTLRRHSEFIDDILQGKLLDARMLSTAKRFGLDLAVPLFCCVIQLGQGGGDSKPVATDMLLQSDIIERLGNERNLFVWDCRGNIGVIDHREAEDSGPEDDLRTAARLMEIITEHHPRLTVAIGVGNRLCGPEGIRKSYRQAASAVMVARIQGQGDTRICHFRHIGIYQFLTHFSGEEEAKEFVRETLDKLIEYDRRKGTDLLHTLEVILESANLKEAAQRLFLHYNTVVHHKGRIERVLGAAVEDVETRLALAAAVKLRKLGL